MMLFFHERGERGIGLLIIGSEEIFIFQFIRKLHDLEVLFLLSVGLHGGCGMFFLWKLVGTVADFRLTKLFFISITSLGA